MNERLAIREKTVLVHVDFPNDSMQEDISEFQDLARSAGAECVDLIRGFKAQAEAKLFVGSGKASEIEASVKEHEAELVIFNHTLSPAQTRNLETVLGCRVIDRTGLILDIFAQRARSFEGKLQVEMAMLKHLSTRLIHSHTDLMRQKGGIGLRGPGETKLEADRRTIRRRMKFLTEKLEKVRLQREQGRRARLKAAIPTVALVGYTNAGKSTLFNRLCSSEVYAANQLFATLDPTLRRVDMSDLGPVIFADTVGFIRHLPHDLVEAFRATLVEVAEADLLLHVIDIADSNRQANIDQVNTVLESIGASEVPQIFVFNKIDLKNEALPQEPLLEDENHLRVWISAQTGFHLEDLEAAIRRVLGKDRKEYTVVVKPESGRLRASLYEAKSVVSESIDSEGNWHLVVRLSEAEYQRLF